MSSISPFRKSANEKNIDELMEDTVRWDKEFIGYAEEISFFKTLLSSDVFETNMPDLYERLQEFYTKIADIKEEKIQLQEAIRNHRNDLNGMMECEDISCESFYHSQHHDLMKKVEKHFLEFRELKYNLIRFLNPLLKKVK